VKKFTLSGPNVNTRRASGTIHKAADSQPQPSNGTMPYEPHMAAIAA